MAIVGLEDLDGVIDLLIFPKSYKEFGHYIVKDAILFFKGNLDKKEQDPKLLVNEITPVVNIHKKFTRSVHLRFMTESMEQTQLQAVQQILSQHPGSIPVYLEFIDPSTKARSQMLVDRTLFVQPNENLLQALSNTLGDEAINLKI